MVTSEEAVKVSEIKDNTGKWAGGLLAWAWILGFGAPQEVTLSYFGFSKLIAFLGIFFTAKWLILKKETKNAWWWVVTVLIVVYSLFQLFNLYLVLSSLQ